MTYKPGATVPRDGTVKCTEYNGTQGHVKAGTKFRAMRPLGRSSRQELHLAVRLAVEM